MIQCFCEKCGLLLEADDVSCPNCGALVGREVPQRMTTLASPRASVRTVLSATSPVQTVDESLAVADHDCCPRCGRKRMPEWKFCIHCGVRLDEGTPIPALTTIIKDGIVNEDVDDAYGLDAAAHGLLDDEKERPIGSDEGGDPATLVYDMVDEDDSEVLTMVYQDQIPDPAFVMCRRETGETFRLELPATLGRGKDASVRIEGNPYIGRLHAHLFLLDDELTVEDNGSANGTFVNGKRVEVGTPVQIEEGDVLTLAKEEFDITVE